MEYSHFILHLSFSYCDVSNFYVKKAYDQSFTVTVELSVVAPVNVISL